jgi:hypothetical protein
VCLKVLELFKNQERLKQNKALNTPKETPPQAKAKNSTEK